MTRIALKITGAQGQGIDSIGAICAKGLKRAGYCIFGYREFMSVIKGGHSSFQLDVSDELVRSSQQPVDILVCFNHHGLEKNTREVRDGGVIIHQTPDWQWTSAQEKDLKRRKITVFLLPTEQILTKLKAKPILGNMLITSVVWALLGQSVDQLKALAKEQFGHKKDLLELNMCCIDEGFALKNAKAPHLCLTLPEPSVQWKDHMLLTGSHAMGLGAMHAGVRVYAGYPMTPSSPLLTFIADIQNDTGMVVKQAEDEITAAQFVSGAMYMGARALTATSGGGFDLMSESISMNAIIENPTVFVLAQRPGPATGLPTWTAQADLLLAVNTAHGEFTRAVMAVSDTQDCFDLMPTAFNLAEEFQTPIIVLTDKQIAEALYTQPMFDQKKTKMSRGKLVTATKDLVRLKSSDRYDPKTKDGVSLRWLPGAASATYCAQADEHNAEGTVEESAENTKAQFEKRMRKMEALKKKLPEPELYQALSGELRAVSTNERDVDVLLVGWGSTKGPVLDVIEALTQSPKPKAQSFAYLHFTYLWPLKTKRFQALVKKAKRVVLVEGNHQGQLGMLLTQCTGIEIKDRILKYDGRPFFFDELQSAIRSKPIAHSS